MSWGPLNLANLPDREPVRPTIGSGGIIYPGARHLFSGEPESAKTIAAYAIALNAIRAGRSVALLDFESGPIATRRVREVAA